jgi:uncharacterized protein (DUF433 family)
MATEQQQQQDLAHRVQEVAKDVEFLLKQVIHIRSLLEKLDFRPAVEKQILIPTPPDVLQNYLQKIGLSVAGSEREDIEGPVAGWKHLVRRHHPWRKQLYLKGRNLTVRQLVGSIKANKLSPQEASESFELPVEAIEEALRYAEENKPLLDYEAFRGRQLLQEKGYDLASETLPG